MFRVSVAAVGTGLADCGHEIAGELAVLGDGRAALGQAQLRLHWKTARVRLGRCRGSAERACPWVAVWVADGRLRALFGVALRCSGSLFWLVMLG